MKFVFIEEYRETFSIGTMCSVLEVSRAAYYKWKRRSPSARELRHERLLVSIQAAHKASRHRYGYPRIYRQLRREGVACGRHQIAQIMRCNGIQGRYKRKFRVTTVANARHPVAKNLLDRNFSPAARDRSWAADITYVWTLEGWLYLAVVLDLFSRRVVGWATSCRVDERLALDALEMAIAERQPAPGLVHHSDRGCQYTAVTYRRRLSERGFVASMSRRANCWDNAVVESFFHSMKSELSDSPGYASRAEAQRDIEEYITGFYNCKRLHSTIGFTTPVEYEMTANP